jgi:hypothetical protein
VPGLLSLACHSWHSHPRSALLMFSEPWNPAVGQGKTRQAITKKKMMMTMKMLLLM